MKNASSRGIILSREQAIASSTAHGRLESSRMKSAIYCLMAIIAVAGCQSADLTASSTARRAPATVPAATFASEALPGISACPAVTISGTPPQPIIGRVAVDGDIAQPGSRALHRDEKVSDLLRTLSPASPVGRLTVVLVRRGPEGTTSEIIDLASDLSVIDKRHDYDLRDGDQLVISVAAADPQGLVRPVATNARLLR